MGRALGRALQDEPGRLLSVLIQAVGDLDRAEDALQDAVVAAWERWPCDGIPRNPAGWLFTTARRRAIDAARRSSNWREKSEEFRVLRELETLGGDSEPDFPLPDERLRLIFTCCHPVLPVESRVALTLRTVGGLSTAQVARALMTTEATMKQRLVRAKRGIREAGIPYTVPSDELLAQRLGGVLAVLYLVFNEGYAPTFGSAVADRGLCAEAIRLTRLVADALPDPELLGLLALMRFQDSRAEARTASDGSLVLLEDQDRSRWDGDAIREANALLESAALHRSAGLYQLQAAIAAEHANATSSADTAWDRIATLYDRLLDIAPSPVLGLNRAVAHGMASGPDVGLRLTEALEGLDRYHLWHATQGDMLRRLGRSDEAATAYRRAIELATNESERRFLHQRLDQAVSATITRSSQS